MFANRCRSLLTALLTAALAAQTDPIAGPSKQELAARRATLAKAAAAAFPERHVVIALRGAAKTADMGAFVQNQDFLYLSGVAEPDLAMLLVVGADGALTTDELLVPPFSRFTATWDGSYLAPGEKAAERTGFAVVGNVRSLDERLAKVLGAETERAPVLLTLTRPGALTGGTPGKAADAAKATRSDAFDGRRSREETFVAAVQKRFPGLGIESLEALLHQQRQVKSAHEIELLRQSSRIAGLGIAEAMRSARPGRHEFELAAVARLLFTLHGAGPDAYAAIVGGGPNGCVLHYNACTRQLLDSDLIVMDYAPTLHGYASDVTRTFPASGTFSPEQRKLVQDVHDIQQQLIAMVKPGARLSAIGERCAELLAERGYVSDHGPCHHVGLAVHDPQADVLRPGMVITVEPGAYLRKVGMGCRIEDTILVTENDREVLSDNVPSTPDAIEGLMREDGVLDRLRSAASGVPAAAGNGGGAAK